MGTELSAFAEIVSSGCEHNLKQTPEILKANYDKQKYGLAATNLKGALEDAIQMAMIAYKSGGQYECAYSKLSLGEKYVDELLKLCERTASLEATKIDRDMRISGFSLAFVLIYCMLLKDYQRLKSVVAVLESNKNIVYGDNDLEHISMMFKAFAKDDKDEFEVHHQPQQSKKNRAAGYDLSLALCRATLIRDQDSFDKVLAEIEAEYPKRKISRAYKNTKIIWGGGEYNELFFEFFATAIASYAKKLGMRVKPSSDIAIPAVFL